MHLLTYVNGNVLDIRYLGNSGSDAIWAMSINQQAQNRNTHLLTYGLTSQLFGPCTSELLYETAAIVTSDVSSGVAVELGTRPTGCKYHDYASGLENKFAAEVTKASSGLKRSAANDIVKTFLPRYEDRLQRPDKGKSFRECYDIENLKPIKEWQEIYDKVWKELEDLGLPQPI
ncbi:MAG: monomethylamine:corrinoid methyltransferase [Methanobacteriota archaeon]